jgi:hypothetical protein
MGRRQTEETKARISAANKGRIRSPEQLVRQSAAMTADRRAAIRVALLGHAVTPETRAKMSANGTKHGDARNGGTTKLYRVWTGMRNRCSNPRSRSWSYYGGRGIVVCGEWGTFAAFKEWAISHGYREGLSIDRVDPTKGYEPSNCEWVTIAENGRRSNATTVRNGRGSARGGHIGTCARWNIARGKPCVCGAHA